MTKRAVTAKKIFFFKWWRAEGAEGELWVGTRHSGSSHGTLSKELFPREVKFPGRKFVLYNIRKESDTTERLN